MAATLLRPDQSFYPSPRLAGQAPVETLAYMVWSLVLIASGAITLFTTL